MNTDKMITREAAAARLGVSMRTLDRYLRQGRIAYAKYNRMPYARSAGPVRVSDASLTAYMEAAKVAMKGDDSGPASTAVADGS